MQAEVDRLVERQRQVSRQQHALRARPDEGVEHQFTDARELAQPGHQRGGNMQQFRMRVGLCARRVSEVPQVRAHHPGDQRAAHIGAHRLRARDPVIARCPFHRLKALIDQHHDAVAMVGRNRFALLGVVRVIHPRLGLANADQIGAQKITQRLDAVRVALCIGKLAAALDRQLRRARALQRHHVANQRRHRERQRVFGGKTQPFRFGLFAQVTGQRAGEQISTFAVAADFIAQHQRGRLRHTLDGFHRIASQMQRALRLFRLLPAGAGSAFAHVGVGIRPVERGGCGNRQIRCQRQIGSDHAERKTGAQKRQAQLAIHRFDNAGALRQVFKVDLSVKGDVAARGVTQRAQIACQHHCRFGHARIGARDIGTTNPFVPGLAGLGFAPELDGEHQGVGVRARLRCGGRRSSGVR